MKSATVIDENIVIPVAFCNAPSSSKEPTSRRSELGQSFRLTAKPSCMCAWGYGADEELVEAQSEMANGAVMGCEDGTAYIFHCDDSFSKKRRSTRSNELASLVHDTLSLHPNRYHGHMALSNSRSASPSGSRTNLVISSSSKSQAVSGLTREQVEAPKNYVDFDDEQEKLKDMLHDRSVKDRTVMDGLRSQFEKDVVVDKASRPSKPRVPSTFGEWQRADEARSVGSSSSSTPRSVPSPPASPRVKSISESRTYRKRLSLKVKVVLRCSGDGHAVVDVKVLKDSHYCLVLQESGDVSLSRTRDGCIVDAANPGHVPSCMKALVVVSQGIGAQIVWSWKTLHVAETTETVFIAAVASANEFTTIADDETRDKTRVCIFALNGLQGQEFGETQLEKLGDFVFDGRAEAVELLRDADGSIKLYQVTSSKCLVIRSLRILPTVALPSRRATPDSNHIHPSTSIQLPNALKGLISRPEQEAPLLPVDAFVPRIEFSSEVDVGEVQISGDLRGLRLANFAEVVMGVLWSDEEIAVFSVKVDGLTNVSKLLAVRPRDIVWLDVNHFRAVLKDRIDSYFLSHADNSEETTTPQLYASNDLKNSSLFSFVGNYEEIVIFREEEAERCSLELRQITSSRTEYKSRMPRKLWSGTNLGAGPAISTPFITSLLPLELATIVVAYSDGTIKMQSFRDLLKPDVPAANDSWKTSVGLEAAIVGMHPLTNCRTGESYIIGGADDGSISVWDQMSLTLRARWIIFTEPLRKIIHLTEENTGRLLGCCLCVSRDGTIAVIVVDGFELLYLIPGSAAKLQRLCLGSDNLLLFYSDGRTRLWDVKTREFWRSMDAAKASELLSQGGWFDTEIEESNVVPAHATLTAINKPTVDGEPSPTLRVDIIALVDHFIRGFSEKGLEKISLEHMKAVLATLLTPGLDGQIDRLVVEYLGVADCAAVLGFLDARASLQWFTSNSPSNVWEISPDVTAIRLLSAVALLRVLMNVNGYEGPSSTILSFYTSTLPNRIGTAYQAPSLPILAYHSTESQVSEIRSAAKLLFDNELSRLPDETIIANVEKWQHRLPCLQPEVEKRSPRAALALSLCGNLAIEKYSLLSSPMLGDIAKSITIHLYDETSPYRVLAIDLCSRGFEIFQHYFDAMEALRSLFVLATTSRKEAISVRNPGPQARMAVLQIAASNSPLFMTTLSLDILHPRSVDYSKSVMQIVAFLIRKKPLVLFPSLPRLLEAVVKSLDPSSTADREAVLDAVTEIISLVVRSFPTVDFHAGTQRLAVGTSEGAVIMYDLKTATRLFVLEGHRKKLAGISFSPDGRRLVTLSLEESVVLVWKVGSGFASFFNPGAPPRQGRGGSEPYKTLNFKTSGESKMSVEATMELVSFEWPADRSVKVKIRETILTFST